MTRKRFVKLLMSRGYSRNEANSRASVVVSARCTYEQVLFAAKLETGDSEALEALQAVCERIAAAVQSMSEAARNAVRAITAAMPFMVGVARKYADEEYCECRPADGFCNGGERRADGKNYD